jgi:hypothetical protein
MSIVYTADVHCDRCGNWAHSVTGHKPDGLATRSLKLAKANGWSRSVRSIYTDLCPDCLKNARKSGDPKK